MCAHADTVKVKGIFGTAFVTTNLNHVDFKCKDGYICMLGMYVCIAGCNSRTGKKLILFVVVL